MAPKPRLGLPKPDRAHPGRWRPITREEQPEAFRTPEEQAEADRRYTESVARLEAIRRAEAAEPADTTTPDNDEENGEETFSEQDNERDSSYVPSPERRPARPRTRPSTPAPAVEAEEEEPSEEAVVPEEADDDDDGEEDDGVTRTAETLGIYSEPWKAGQPMSHPLTYAIPAAGGGQTIKKIAFRVDFNDKASVAKANKARFLARGRAMKKTGQPLLRPSTAGREYTQQNDDWIKAEHDRYAVASNGIRIPLPELTRRYNNQFPQEGRTQFSITSHMDRNKELKAKRGSFSPS